MKTKKLTTLSMLTAIALTIFMVEAQIPPLTPIPGIKMGLSNIITVFIVFAIGPREAAAVLFVRVFLGAVFAGNQLFGFSGCRPYLHVVFLVPLAYGQSAVEVVGAQEYQDGIYILSVLFVQLLYLAGHIVPFASADAVYIRGDVEPFL